MRCVWAPDVPETPDVLLGDLKARLMDFLGRIHYWLG